MPRRSLEASFEAALAAPQDGGEVEKTGSEPSVSWIVAAASCSVTRDLTADIPAGHSGFRFAAPE